MSVLPLLVASKLSTSLLAANHLNRVIVNIEGSSETVLNYSLHWCGEYCAGNIVIKQLEHDSKISWVEQEPNALMQLM